MWEGYITALHLKESLPGIFREVPYGSGHVPFEQMIEKAGGLGVRKYTAEFWYKGKQPLERGFRIGLFYDAIFFR